MLRRTVATAVALALVLGGSLAGCQRQSTPGPDVWATVNGKEIKRDEVEKYYRTRLPEGQPLSHEESLSLMLSILDELINTEILLDRARKAGLEASDGEVEDKFTERKSPFTEDAFQRQLKDRGVTVEDLKREIRRELSIQKLINREVVAKIGVTDQDITDFYNENRAQFNFPETQYRVAQIVVTPKRDAQVRNRAGDDAGTDADAKRKIAALQERLNQGSDFAQVAMEYSEDPVTSATGGDLGFIPESSLNQADAILKKEIVSLRPGEISRIITGPNSYRILKLLAREPAGLRTLEDERVRASIRDTLRNRKEQILRASYLTVARDEAKVANYLARQVIESNGKLPEIPPFKPGGSAAPAKQ